MYSVSDDSVNLLVNYEDVFKGKRPNVIDEIKNNNMHKMISIICELISVCNSTLQSITVCGVEIKIPYQSVLKAKFCKLQYGRSEEPLQHSLLRKDYHIISSQMLLILLKMTICYGDYDTLNLNDYEITSEDYKKIIKLQLTLVSEVEERHREYIDGNHFLYSTYHFNSERNLANDIARMYYMLEKISPYKSAFDDEVQSEYRDYYSVFLENYKYRPIEYIALLFWEVGNYYDDQKKLTCNSLWSNIDDKYAKLKNRDMVKDIINLLSKPLEHYKEWALTTKSNEWDFSMFYDKPFLLDNNGNYISMSDITLKNAFFEKMFWLIRECYPTSDSRAMAFFGRLFEMYVQKLSEASVSNDYSYIKEFSLCGKKKDKSSELYIRKGSKLCAVEVKGFSVLLDCMIKNESIEKNNNKLFVNPILQADEFLFKAQEQYFEGAEQYYIISVTLDNVNAVPQFYEDIFKQIEEKKQCDKTKCYFNFSIKEYEMLMYLTENNYDIFELLNEYFTKTKLKPFSSFLIDKYPDIGRTKFISELYNEAVQEMKKTLDIE